MDVLARVKDAIAPKSIRALRNETRRCGFREYCNAINPEFFRPDRAYQDILCETMQRAYEKKLINPETGKPYDILIINLPPGFGKSYTNMMFTTWAYGRNIKNKLISLSYNQTLSTEFAKGVKALIQDKETKDDKGYYCVNSFFPELKIKNGDSAKEKWSLEGRGVYRSYLATSFGGSITGMRGNIIIIDDPIKNHVEAVSDRIKDAHWAFFRGTLPSRVLPGGLQIVIQTRWATDDLAGRIINDAEYGKRCYVLEMKALSEDSENGVSLCESLYPTEDLQAKRRAMIPELWAANFMQTPLDIKGMLYGEFNTYATVDYDRFERIIAYIDTADEGTDFLCAVMGGVIGRFGYVTDVYYTDASMEDTEPETARKLADNGIRECIIESNNGGRGFARNVIRELAKIGDNAKGCCVTWFHQSKNKRTRIIVNATNVMEQIIMPEGWERRWPLFAKAVKGYQRKGKNAHDDVADGLTGFAELVNGDVKGRKKVRVQNRGMFGGRI